MNRLKGSMQEATRRLGHAIIHQLLNGEVSVSVREEVYHEMLPTTKGEVIDSVRSAVAEEIGKIK